MAKPTLIIGLGVTGIKILTCLKKALLDYTGGEGGPGEVRLIAVDFDTALQIDEKKSRSIEKELIAVEGVKLDTDEYFLLDGGNRRYVQKISEENPHIPISCWFPVNTYFTRLSAIRTSIFDLPIHEISDASSSMAKEFLKRLVKLRDANKRIKNYYSVGIDIGSQIVTELIGKGKSYDIRGGSEIIGCEKNESAFNYKKVIIVSPLMDPPGLRENFLSIKSLLSGFEAGGRRGASPSISTSGLSSLNLPHIIYTFGSTGQPKGTLVEHLCLSNFFTHSEIYRTDEQMRWCLHDIIEFPKGFDYRIRTRGFRIKSGEIEDQRVKHCDIKKIVGIFERKNIRRNKYLYCYIPLKTDSEGAPGPVPPGKLSGLREYLLHPLPNYICHPGLTKLEAPALTTGRKVLRKIFAWHEVLPVTGSKEFAAFSVSIPAHLFDIDRYKLSQKFKYQADLPPEGFLFKGTITRADFLLKAHVDIPIKEKDERIWFWTSDYFIRKFRIYYGIEPGLFKELRPWRSGKDCWSEELDHRIRLSAGQNKSKEIASRTRPFGRWAAFKKPGASPGNSTVLDVLRDSIRDIGREIERDRSLEIYIIISLGGGMGSGMVLDTAYIARTFTEDIIDSERFVMCGFFVLPRVLDPEPGGDNPGMRVRNFAAIWKLGRFTSAFGEHMLPMFYDPDPRFVDTLRKPLKKRLFYLCYLVDPHQAGSNLDDVEPEYTVIQSIAEALLAVADEKGKCDREQTTRINNTMPKQTRLDDIALNLRANINLTSILERICHKITKLLSRHLRELSIEIAELKFDNEEQMIPLPLFRKQAERTPAKVAFLGSGEYTSGSIGQPKGMLVKNLSLSNFFTHSEIYRTDEHLKKVKKEMVWKHVISFIMEWRSKAFAAASVTRPAHSFKIDLYKLLRKFKHQVDLAPEDFLFNCPSAEPDYRRKTGWSITAEVWNNFNLRVKWGIFCSCYLIWIALMVTRYNRYKGSMN